MAEKPIWQRPFTWLFTICCLIFIISIIFTLVNDKFYRIPLAQVTDVKEVHTKHITDDHHNHDTKHTQRLTLKMLNGKYEGQTTTLHNTYAESQADSEKFSTHNKVLLHVDKNLKDMYIIEKKRDTLVVTLTGIFILTVLWAGKRIGIHSILSLVVNSIAVLAAITIHNAYPSINLFGLMSVAVILGTIVTLLLVIGWNLRTGITIVSTLLGTFICVGLMQLIISLTGVMA